MIAVAIWFTVSSSDDSPGPDGSSDGSDALRIVCLVDLEAVCDGLESTAADDDRLMVTTEAASATITAYAEGEGPDVWVTATPWPGLAEVRVRAASGSRFSLSTSDSIAQRSLEVVLTPAWSVELNAACGGNLTWRCVVDQVGQPPAVAGSGASGVFKLGVASPDRLDGAVAIGGLADGWFAADPELAEIWDGFDVDNSFLGPFNSLKSKAGRDADPLTVFVTRRGTYGGVVTLGATQRRATMRPFEATVAAPAPAVAAGIVVATTDATARTRFSDRVDDTAILDLAIEAGWTVPTVDNTGRPNPDLLELLLTKWTN